MKSTEQEEWSQIFSEGLESNVGEVTDGKTEGTIIKNHEHLIGRG